MQIVDGIWLTLAGFIILVLPGLTFETWFSQPGKDAAERLADAVGISLAVTALIASAGFYLSIRFDGLVLAAIYGVLAVFLVIGWVVKRPGHWPQTLLALGLCAGVIAWRFFQARDLVLPAWVDSLHHVLIVQVIRERGGLPADLAPYLPIPFSYHFSFHAVTALFSTLANLSPANATLNMGQVINALICLSVYRLGKVLWGNSWVALGAALLTAFFSQLPAYYLTWGRYTLLTGLVLLPLAMAAATDILTGPRSTAGLVRFALLTAGTALSHYLAFFLLFLYCLYGAIGQLSRDLRQKKLNLGLWRDYLGAGLAGVLLAAPWLIRFFQYSNTSIIPAQSTWSANLLQVLSSDYGKYLWTLIGPPYNYLVLAGGILGLGLAFVDDRRRLFAAWSFTLAIFSLPWTITLGDFRPDHFAIIVFLPAVLLASGFLLAAARLASRLHPSPAVPLGIFLAVILGLSAWGMWETRSIVNPITILADASDEQAIQWINANTSPDSRFLINTTAWQNGTYRGVDGGAWILTLTGRWIVQPPPFFAWGAPDYVAETNSIASRASNLTGCTPAFWSLIKDARIGYVYVKAGKGTLQAAELKSCANLEEEFQAGQVSVFAVHASQ